VNRLKSHSKEANRRYLQKVFCKLFPEKLFRFKAVQAVQAVLCGSEPQVEVSTSVLCGSKSRGLRFTDARRHIWQCRRSLIRRT
jgi:hypothetical protein